MIRVAIIDDHPLVLDGIGTWLNGTGRFDIAGTAANLTDAALLLETIEPFVQIVILDLSLGQEDGLKIIPVIKEICEKRNSKIPGILVLSMYEDSFLIQRTMDSGADAYVCKSADTAEILKGIDAVLAGEKYFNAKYKIKLQNQLASLTPRENEIVFMVRRSMSNKEIAKRLSLSIRTVENHLARIYVKTGTYSRGELLEL